MSACKVWICADLLIDFREVTAHTRTEVGEWTTCVDKGDEKNIATILLERDVLAALIGEGKIGNVFSGCGHMERIRAGGVGRVDMRGDFDVFEPVVGRSVLIFGLHDDNVGGDGIAGKQVVQGCGGLEFVGHGHGVHETGDGVAVDDGRLRLSVDGYDAAGEGIALSCRSFGARRKEESARKKQSEQGAGSMVFHVVNTLTRGSRWVPGGGRSGPAGRQKNLDVSGFGRRVEWFTRGAGGSARATRLDGEQALEERTIALQGDAQVLGGDVVAAIPLPFEV